MQDINKDPIIAIAITEACFMKFASLDQSNFYASLTTAGFPDMSESPLASFVFKGLAMDNSADGVILQKFHEAIDTATVSRQLFQTYAKDGGLSLEMFQEMGIRCLGKDNNIFPSVRAAFHKDPSVSPHTSTDNARSKFVRSMLDKEAFDRYNVSHTGKMNEAELLSFLFAIRILCDVFMEIVGDNFGLNRETYPAALKRIGVACLEKTFQGQFMDAVFTRTDRDETGIISYAEFVKAGMCLIYPSAHHNYIRSIRGYPGCSALVAKTADVDKIIELVSSLKTGDVILAQDDTGPMGQFINFSLNTPWSHASVVVKRSPLTGTPNSKTEELLQQFSFRRAAHHFCSPGYCRCYDASMGDFASSRLSGLGEIGMLESTGEGIHLYDLAHRLFESGTKKWTAIAIARLHDAPGRDDTEKINEFIEQVRGGIYTVAKDELKAAISFHHTNSDQTVPPQQLPEGARGTDDFCASLVYRFYHHMGWVDKSRPFNSVMPSDFDAGAQENVLAGTASGTLTTYPIELLDGKGWLSPLELVTSPDLNALLPIKLPRKKKKL